MFWLTGVIAANRAELLIDLLHLFDAFKIFRLVVGQSHLIFKKFHDFANIFELVEEFLMMAAALRSGPGSYEGGELVIKLHFPKFIIALTSSFSWKSSISYEDRQK